MIDDQLLSITEVGDATGLPSSTLRYYEKVGLIKSHDRRGGRRHYRPGVLQRLAVIALLQEAGFTISEIATLLDPGRKEDWRGLAEDKLNEIDGHIEKVQRARDVLASALSCGCANLDACDLVEARRGRHERVVQTLSVGFRPARQEKA